MFIFKKAVMIRIGFLLGIVLFSATVCASSGYQKSILPQKGSAVPSGSNAHYKPNDDRKVYNQSTSADRSNFYNTDASSPRYYNEKRMLKRDGTILYVRNCKSVDEVIYSFRSKSGGEVKVVGIKRVKEGYRVTLQYPDGRVRVKIVSC